jgi:hypothetical protein
MSSARSKRRVSATRLACPSNGSPHCNTRTTISKRSRRGLPRVGNEAKPSERLVHGTRNRSGGGAGLVAFGRDMAAAACRWRTGGSSLSCTSQLCCSCHRWCRRLFKVVALTIAGVAAALDALLSELQQDLTSSRC